MKKLSTLIGSIIVVLALAFSGCSKQKSDSATLKGAWLGQENGKPGASLVLASGNLEFHGADPKEWYKGTYTLHEDTTPKQMIIVITDCAFPQYVGKTANAIYQVQDGVLTIAANEPGNAAIPAGFNAPGVRQMTFKAQ
jgi:uncharacterized protein (TIGR03067 family)